MVVLGLDLSMTSTGYSVIEELDGEFNLIGYGKINTKKTDFENEDDRINSIVDRIKDIILKEQNIDYIIVENQFISRRTNTIMALRKLLGAVMRMVTSETKIKIIYVSPTTVKKSIGGSGSSTKEDVFNSIVEKYNMYIGEYSDKANSNKTSDIYDSMAVAITFLKTGGYNG